MIAHRAETDAAAHGDWIVNALHGEEAMATLVPFDLPANSWSISAIGPTHDVIPAKAGIHPEMLKPAVHVEVSQDGPRPSPG